MRTESSDKDALFASYAAKNQAQLAKTLGHKMTPQEDFNREFAAGIILFGLIMLIVLWVGWKIGKHVLDGNRLWLTGRIKAKCPTANRF